MKQLIRLFVSSIFWGLLTFLTACGGGGGAAPPSGGDAAPTGLAIANLQGTWTGAFIEAGLIYPLKLTIDSAGNISNVFVNGVASGDTGTTTKTGDNTFGYSLSDGTTGGFLADSAGNHVGILDDANAYGVLQKNASGFPAYIDSDIGGSWSGYSVEVDASLNLTKTYASNATVIGNTGSFTGSDANGSFSGSFYDYAPAHGFWVGTWNSSLSSGNVFAWMSPDKTFAATWACDYSSASVFDIYYVTGCTFSMWNR